MKSDPRRSHSKAGKTGKGRDAQRQDSGFELPGTALSCTPVIMGGWTGKRAKRRARTST